MTARAVNTKPLQEAIAKLMATPFENLDRAEARTVHARLLRALEAGHARAAEPRDGGWVTQPWVKQGILLGFRLGGMEDASGGQGLFIDKDSYPVRRFTPEDGVRVVPGGSSIRSGAFLGVGVVCMPPMYINTGAWVGDGTMVDSHALVGSCAQIGNRVHLSAAVQIGGVLEPPGALPVIVEDDAFIGGGCGIYEGCLVRSRAVLAPGVILTGSTRIYDLARERVIVRDADTGVLEVPSGAVVVPGSRGARGAFAQEHGLGLYAPVIVKYRDAGTAARTALEEALR